MKNFRKMPLITKFGFVFLVLTMFGVLQSFLHSSNPMPNAIALLMALVIASVFWYGNESIRFAPQVAWLLIGLMGAVALAALIIGFMPPEVAMYTLSISVLLGIGLYQRLKVVDKDTF